MMTGQDTSSKEQVKGMLQAFLKFSPDAVIAVNRDGRIVRANRQAESMFGYSPDELVDKSVEVLIPDRLKDEHPAHRKTSMNDPRIRSVGAGLALHGRRKDGSEFPIDVSLSPLDGPHPSLVITTVRDISRFKHVEKDLKALNALALAASQSLDGREILNLALETILDVTGRERGYIRLKDARTGEVTLATARGISDAFVETLLYKRTPGGKSDRVLETGIPLVINDPQANVLKAKTLREGLRSVAWVPMKARGKIVGVLNVGTNKPIPFLPQEVDLMESIGSVIGNAVENARLFEEAQHNLERIHVLYGINLAVTSTLDLPKTIAILLEKIDSLLGYPTVLTIRFLDEETHILKPVACRNLDEEEWKACSYSVSPNAFRAPAVINKAPYVVPDIVASPGNRRPGFYRKHGLVSYLGVPLFAHKEKVIGILSVYTKERHTFSPDEIELISAIGNHAAIAIHNAQLHEEAKKQTEVLEKANQTKDEFMAVMSHELRSPLTVVLGWAELMGAGVLGEVNERQVKALKAMGLRSRDLLNLINNILEAVRLGGESVSVEHSPIQLCELFESLRLKYADLEEKEPKLLWECPRELPEVRTDASKLLQILENLINNAVKFTDKGNVTVSVGLRGQRPGVTEQKPAVGGRESGSATDPQYLEFKVTDTGIGIPKEQMPFIFDRFKQVDSSDTRSHGGVGMGLFIVRKYTELLGGKIEVCSELGKGSTFTVTLPC